MKVCSEEPEEGRIQNDPGTLSAGSVEAVSSVSIDAASVSSTGVVQAESTIRLDLRMGVHVLTTELIRCGCTFFKGI